MASKDNEKVVGPDILVWTVLGCFTILTLGIIGIIIFFRPDKWPEIPVKMAISEVAKPL